MSRTGAVGPRRRGARPVALLLLLLAVAVLAGCASVPDSSSVQVEGRVSEGDGPAQPPGPGDRANPLELVRDFINASASSENRHAAARRFLTPKATGWDDSAALTVINDRFDTSYANSPSDPDTAVVRLHGAKIGRVSSDGSFTQDEAPDVLDFRLVKLDGQWRIDTLPPGTVVRLPDFRANYKAVRLYFTDPVRHRPVADRRYLAASPARTLPSRVMDQLLGGPCAALAGASVSVIPRGARLRSNVVPGPDGSVAVDLTELGDLDDGQRRLIAAQVVLSLAEVNVPKVSLLDDGAPLLSGHQDLTTDSFTDLGDDGAPRPDVPGVVVAGGRARALATNELGGPLPGPSGAGAYGLVSATMSSDGQWLAAVNRLAGRELMIGPADGPLVSTGVSGSSLTRPSWTANGDELWTVRDSIGVTRLVVDQDGHATVQPLDASALTSLGPIGDLRLSRDGTRVAAVVGGQLVVASVVRSTSGDVVLRNARRVRPLELTELVGVDWQGNDELAVVGRRSDLTVAKVSVDGLDLRPLPSNNLTSPPSSVAAAPGRPLLVTDQTGLWSFGTDEVGSWRQLSTGSSTVAGYPG